MTVIILSALIFMLIVCLICQFLHIHKQDEQLRELHKWHTMALTDSLTGIYNRAAYSQHIKKLTEDSVSCNFTCGLVLFDVDNFKIINDTYGHPAGDRVLQSCASLLSSVFAHSNSRVYRIGGDEFAVIIRDMDERYIIDRLLELREKEKTDTNFKLSKGYAISYKNHDFKQMFKYADEMLYADKVSKK